MFMIPAAAPTNSPPMSARPGAPVSPIKSNNDSSPSSGGAAPTQQQQHTSSLPDKLMAEAYALYTPPDAMSGEYKLLDTSDAVCEYILELYEASMMKVKRNTLVLQELARLRAGNGNVVGGTATTAVVGGGGVGSEDAATSPPSKSDVEVASVLQYDDVDLLTYMSTHMQRAVVLEPKYLREDGDGSGSGGGDVVAVHASHGYTWLCERMRQYLKQTVSTGV